MARSRKIQRNKSSDTSVSVENDERMSAMQLRGVRNYVSRREKLNRALCSLNKWCPQGIDTRKPCDVDVQDHTVQN